MEADVERENRIAEEKERDKLRSDLRSMFARLYAAQPVIDYRIRNFTEEDLERFTSDFVRYRALLIDLNNYAYKVFGMYRNMIDLHIDPILYRWSVKTQVNLDTFNPEEQDPLEMQHNLMGFSAKIKQLNLERELKRLLLTMFLEDAVFGYWVEDEHSSTIFYLPSNWCTIKKKTNGNWTYKINVTRISERDIDEILPPELGVRVRHYKQQGVQTMEVPYEKQVCYKFNDHFNAIFPPFTHVLLLIVDLMKAKQLAEMQNEQDVLNLISMKIPIDDKQDDHLRLTNETVEDYSRGLQDLLPENCTILPTPMDLDVLNTGRNQARLDDNIINDAREAYYNETGLPSFGGSNTATEMQAALNFIASKVYRLMDQIANGINLKMKLDGYIYDGYEFVYRMYHMTIFNEDKVLERMRKLSLQGEVNKFELAGAQGVNPAMLVGQYYVENVVYKKMFENLIVPPSSHTQPSGDSEGGAPLKDIDDLSPEGQATRDNDGNIREL